MKLFSPFHDGKPTGLSHCLTILQTAHQSVRARDRHEDGDLLDVIRQPHCGGRSQGDPQCGVSSSSRPQVARSSNWSSRTRRCVCMRSSGTLLRGCGSSSRKPSSSLGASFGIRETGCERTWRDIFHDVDDGLSDTRPLSPGLSQALLRGCLLFVTKNL